MTKTSNASPAKTKAPDTTPAQAVAHPPSGGLRAGQADALAPQAAPVADQQPLAVTESPQPEGTAADPAPALTCSHRIAALPEKGFYRAGRHWPREGTDINRTDYTDAQWEALADEPRLVIVAL